MIWMFTVCLISSVQRHFGSFQFGAIQVTLLWVFVKRVLCRCKLLFLGDKCPVVPFLGHVITVCFVFKETAKLFTKAVVPFDSHKHCMSGPVSLHPHQHLVFISFYFSCSGRCIVIVDCGFNFCFPKWLIMWMSFCVLICHLH